VADDRSPDDHIATASVATGAAERFAKQLASHLGRRAEVGEESGGTRLLFGDGDCLMQPRDTTLELTVTATDGPALDRLTDVVGRHLERFGQRSELTVIWQRA
jgi:hypothetical protein